MRAGLDTNLLIDAEVFGDQELVGAARALLVQWPWTGCPEPASHRDEASDKLFYCLFQSQPDRILQLLPDLAAAAAPDDGGYRFVAPLL